MKEIKQLTQKIKEFRDDRDWEQFHNHKDMALSLVLEASELLEHFQWKKDQEVAEYVKNHKENIGDELADVAIYLFELSDNLGIDLPVAILEKIRKNGIKYPVEKAKGRITKYNKL